MIETWSASTFTPSPLKSLIIHNNQNSHGCGKKKNEAQEQFRDFEYKANSSAHGTPGLQNNSYFASKHGQMLTH